MMRLLVCGDRHWDDYKMVREEIQSFIDHIDNIECIIEGGAHGADFCAKLAAIELGIPYEEYPADWDLYGAAAGPKRNQKMLAEGKPDWVMGFHDNLKNSKGTKGMIKLAEKANIPFYVAHHDDDWKSNGVVHPVSPRPSVGIPIKILPWPGSATRANKSPYYQKNYVNKTTTNTPTQPEI